ncbi:MAG: tyrosine-protein phosphatase [Flammeovirgaceae bacterium]
MFSFLKKENNLLANPLLVDIHSHLLAGIDDGAKSWDESIAMLKTLNSIGYKKFITTPHIMSDLYRNDPIIIKSKLDELQTILKNDGILLEIEAAAEYYLDESLMKKVEQSEELMTFGKKHLLFETSFFSEPLQIKDFIFQATLKGYQLVLAHPERYSYMTLAKAEDLRNRGVQFQLNILSILGFYSKPVQKMAYQLIDNQWIELLGTDCHNMVQANYLQQNQNNKYLQKALQLPLLNNQL